MRTLLVLFACVCALPAYAQRGDAGWRVDAEAHAWVDYRGQRALYLKEGLAVLDGAELTDGVIEFDVAFSDERGFGGVVWRVVDPLNFEHFYLRPHQSGNPDANQYTPVFDGVTAWQLYHGVDHAAPTRYPIGEWVHVKLVVWQDQAQVFIGDMETPAVEIPELKRGVGGGGLGVSASYAPFHFANFEHRELTEAPFSRIAPRAPAAAPGTVMSWQVSAPFPAARLEPAAELDCAAFADLRWQRLDAERTGIANLARLHGVDGEADTVFARTVIRADAPGLKRIRFGYSDRVRVYLNGRPLYDGDNTGFTRDYRYLGTIGLFESLWLPLEAGDNEVWFAVSERFGGWGVIAEH